MQNNPVNEISSYNFAPTAYLLLLALLITTLIILAVYLKVSSKQNYLKPFVNNGTDTENVVLLGANGLGGIGKTHKVQQALALTTLFLAFDLVVFGAFTRLTDSGLGCPDWPGCYANASPVGAREQIEQAQMVLPTGPVTASKAWIEMVHRYWAMTVGLLIICQCAWLWGEGVQRRRFRKHAAAENAFISVHDKAFIERDAFINYRQRLLWAHASLLWVCLQGAFGAWTVTMKLFPLIVTLHLLGALVLLALLLMHARVLHAWPNTQPCTFWWLRSSGALHNPPKGLVIFTVLITLQIALGGWVSTNYAVLACTTFPSCQGSYWPPMDFAQGFELWRALGQQGSGEPIAFSALTAIHYVHRVFAYAVFGVGAILVGRLTREARVHAQAAPQFKKLRNSLLILLLWQCFSGLSNVVLGWPLWAALAHTAGAAVLLMWCVVALNQSFGKHAQPLSFLKRKDNLHS